MRGMWKVNDQHCFPIPRPCRLYRRKNGFLFQQFNLFPHLTALRNIALPLEKVHGHPPLEAQEMARAGA
jgi:ABC-type polar amino acid transport system ATPase subunit